MKLSTEKPPCYEKLATKFPLSWTGRNVAIAYDGVIYSPQADKLPPDVLVHEEVHLKQQAAYEGGPDAFVDRYIADSHFRMQVEIEAYRAQYQFICSVEKLPFFRNKALESMIRDLMSPIYGLPNATYKGIKGALTK